MASRRSSNIRNRSGPLHASEAKTPRYPSDVEKPSPDAQTSYVKKSRPRISKWALLELAEVCDDQVCTEEIKALPQLSHQDIEMQGLLGEGGFSSVFQVKILKNQNGGEEVEEGPPLALKQLRIHKRGRDEEDWMLAVYDLCNETSLLARLAPHENIVDIRGVCGVSVSSAYKNHANGYFFVMEKLESTLYNRLSGWRQEIKQSTGRLSRLRRHHSSTSMSQNGPTSAVTTGTTTAPHNNNSGGLRLLSSPAVYERLNDVAIGIARAMSHLHSIDFQIAMRDLKPQNIGFDAIGTVKLFDFGMARQVHETDTAELAGTFRYISPEAILGHRIGLDSDVYSFGVILYELVTLLKPFDQFFQRGKLVRKEAFVENVVVGGWRPSLSGIPCRATRRLISKCWDPSPRARPCFDRIYFLLNHIVATNTGATTGTPTKSFNPQNGSEPASLPNNTVPAAAAAAVTKPKNSHMLVKSQNSMPEQVESRAATPVVDLCSDIQSPLSQPKSNRSSFRGLFRNLKPLSKQSSRILSDVTAETAASSGTCIVTEQDL